MDIIEEKTVVMGLMAVQALLQLTASSEYYISARMLHNWTIDRNSWKERLTLFVNPLLFQGFQM